MVGPPAWKCVHITRDGKGQNFIVTMWYNTVDEITKKTLKQLKDYLDKILYISSRIISIQMCFYERNIIISVYKNDD